jgi:hypothetical protein
MQSAVKSAKSVHMTGSLVSGSQTITFDLSFYGRSDTSGTFSDGNGAFSLLIVNGTTYIKANSAFLKLAKAPASACRTICGKYIKLPAPAAGQLTGSLSMSGLTTQMFGSLPTSVTNNESNLFVRASYDGQPVLKFSGGGYTIDVASTGPAYPLLIKGQAGDSLTFSQWNALPAPVAPPASQVVNISHL